MKKADLINMIIDTAEMQTGREITKVDAEAVLDSLAHVMQKTLAYPAELTLPNIGKFSVSKRAARTGRNPQTGAPIEIPASNGVRFKATKALKEALNQS
ncbi:MAG: HU family DNA-binding protein [Pontibacterium sp.]